MKILSLFTVPTSPQDKIPTIAKEKLGSSQHGLQVHSDPSSPFSDPSASPVPVAGSRTLPSPVS